MPPPLLRLTCPRLLALRAALPLLCEPLNALRLLLPESNRPLLLVFRPLVSKRLLLEPKLLLLGVDGRFAAVLLGRFAGVLGRFAIEFPAVGACTPPRAMSRPPASARPR